MASMSSLIGNNTDSKTKAVVKASRFHMFDQLSQFTLLRGEL